MGDDDDDRLSCSALRWTINGHGMMGQNKGKDRPIVVVIGSGRVAGFTIQQMTILCGKSGLLTGMEEETL